MRDICKVFEEPLFKNHLGSGNSMWKIRNGEKALFWEDCWVEKIPLKFKFRKLYQILTLKENSVHDFVQKWTKHPFAGKMFWSRNLRSWELDELQQIDKILKEVSLCTGNDQLFWSDSKSGYSVKQTIELLTPHNVKVHWYFMETQNSAKNKIFL